MDAMKACGWVDSSTYS